MFKESVKIIGNLFSYVIPIVLFVDTIGTTYENQAKCKNFDIFIKYYDDKIIEYKTQLYSLSNENIENYIDENKKIHLEIDKIQKFKNNLIKICKK